MAHLKRNHEVRQQLLVVALVVTLTVFFARNLQAIIFGGEGNAPHADPGWPAGAEVIFNNPARVAWWEGPPLGGGQWHAECRGDAAALSGVLSDFAKLDVKRKRVILHDGTGKSFWLNPNRVPAKAGAANVDWVFMVWQPANWTRLRTLPTDLNPTEGENADQGPPSEIDVYTGGTVHWSDVAVPKGIEIDDQRLEAHGFKLADGVVIEGSVIDLTNQHPISAQVSLQRVEPQPKGGYLYPAIAQTAADRVGHWVLKDVPSGSFRIVIAADGFVPRILGHISCDEQPRWLNFKGGLLPPASVTGIVTDDQGAPLADVEVRCADVASPADGRYESPDGYTCQTDHDGSFKMNQLPIGTATVRLHKSGYCKPGLGESIKTPTTDIRLKMVKAAHLTVTVDFGGAVRLPGAGYIVELTPEGGDAVGKWGGSGMIDTKEQISFADIPPGNYQLTGHPNPSRVGDRTGPFPVELTGGQDAKITLVAK